MNDEEDLSEQEQEIRDLLVTASGARMPDVVFSRISQALSVEVQLRREDPEREGPFGHRRTPSMGDGPHEPAARALQRREATELPAHDDVGVLGRSGRADAPHLDDLDRLDGARLTDRDHLDDLDDCGTRD